MSEPHSKKFPLWAQAQARALLAEEGIARRAAEYVAGRGCAPSPAEVRTALILRTKATALLMSVLAEVAAPGSSAVQEDFEFSTVPGAQSAESSHGAG